jgi:trans-2,3-dihydro-3-hydroxyanthranilic acid synthase
MAGLPTITDYPLPTADSLPPNTVEWIADPGRCVLLFHDMQNYFLNALPTPLRSELVHNAALLRKRCVELGVPIAYTAQPARMTWRERGLLQDFWGPGIRDESEDFAVVAELAPAPGDWLFTKWRYSAFFRSDLRERMWESGRDQLILSGVYAHVGVLMTAVDAFTQDIRPFLVADAIADFSEADHRLALDYAARRCGMVVCSDEVFG